MTVDWDKLEREAEMGKRVLAYLNWLELRRQEDRIRMAQIKQVARELEESYAKGAAA